MVAPPSFENPSASLAAALRVGATGESTPRPAPPRRSDITPAETRPAQTAAAPAIAGGDPVRGDRPVSQTLSAPFVAQFIAQEVNPQASRARDPVDTARAFDAFRQALANAEPTR